MLRSRHKPYSIGGVLVIMFGDGGFYFGGPASGGRGLGVVLLNCLVIYFMGELARRAERTASKMVPVKSAYREPAFVSDPNGGHKQPMRPDGARA